MFAPSLSATVTLFRQARPPQRVEVALHRSGVLPWNAGARLGNGGARRDAQQRVQGRACLLGLAELPVARRQEAMGGREVLIEVKGLVRVRDGFVVAFVG